MPTYTHGPCYQWADLDDICGPCVPYIDSDPDTLNTYLSTASEILYELSGRQYPGTCHRTIRPCAQYVSIPTNFRQTSTVDTSRYPRLWDGYCSCNRSRQCGCSSLSEIDLGPQPVHTIFTIKVDGSTLSSTQYRIDDNHWLVRLPDSDGTNPGWPCCQRLDLEDTEDQTFSIEYSSGYPVPGAGRLAATALACQLFFLCNPGTGTCQLPSNLNSLARQGVSVDVATFLSSLDNRRFGIAEVDMFLSVYGPKGNGFGGVLSPDIGPRYRTSEPTTAS